MDKAFYIIAITHILACTITIISCILHYKSKQKPNGTNNAKYGKRIFGR